MEKLREDVLSIDDILQGLIGTVRLHNDVDGWNIGRGIELVF